MGPKQSTNKSKQQQFFSQYQIIQQIPEENIRFLEHKSTKIQYLLRQLIYNDKKEYLKAIQNIKSKKQQLKNADHVTPITDYFQKQQDQYCSTFYKLYVLFEFPQRTLDDQINERNLRKNNFAQTEIWSILASCILGLGHLQKKGIKHSTLKSSMIFLSQQGHIKISDPFALGCQANYQTLLSKRTTRHIYLSPQQCQALQNQAICPSINAYKSDIFTLGMIILECGLLQYQDECYRDENSRIHWETLEYNKNRFRRQYSEQLGNMLEYMLGQDFNHRPEWIELQNYVITDNTGKSFISQGRKSGIIGYSKPVSVNAQNVPMQGSQMGLNGSQKPFTQPNIISTSIHTTNHPNRGIKLNNSKPQSVHQTNQIISNNINRNDQVISEFRSSNTIYQNSSIVKPVSIGNLPPYSGSNFTPTNFNSLGKPQIPQIIKNMEVQPANISNISASRPLRSIFPNPFYQTKTKSDENLINVQEDDQTSQNASESTYQNLQNSGNNSRSINSYNNMPSSYSQSLNNFNHPSNINGTNSSSQHHSIYNFGPNVVANNSNHFEKKTYEGEFVLQTFKLGSRYEGYKVNGMRHGPGKFFYQDGGMYDGNWVQNKMHGYGKLYYQSGKIAYDGEWIKDQFMGQGTLYNENPDPLNEQFNYQNLDNVEQLWTKYQGSFSDDSKNGKGILYLSNGEYFEGNFANDIAEGEGTYTTINGRKIRGIWENNILVNQF